MVNEIPSTFFDFQVLYTCGTKLEVVNIAAVMPTNSMEIFITQQYLQFYQALL